MQKIKWIIVFGLLDACNAQGQSLVQKFKENTFILSDAKKSTDGFYYDNVSYNLKEGLILMINAVGNGSDIRPLFAVNGTTVNGIENVATLKFIDTSSVTETNAVYLINKTDDYTIVVANGRNGNKGTIKTKMGLGNMAWLGDAAIFPTTNKSPFALALKNLLFHAIFQFNLIKGEKRQGYIGRIYDNNYIIPGAIMKSAITNFGDYGSGVKYNMGEIVNRKFPQKEGYKATDYDKGDSVIAIKKYDSLRAVLKSSLPNDFSLEKEERFKLMTDDVPAKNGLRIIYAHTGNNAIIDPSNNLPDLLASNKMKIELSLEIGSIISNIYLRIYSENK